MISAGGLGHIRTLATAGQLGVLGSPPPTATIPSWTNILTGVNPGRHGLYDFTRRDGYSIRFGTGDRREAPNLFEMLSALGRTVVAIGFPGTFPAVRVRGAMLAGWDSPAALRGKREGCHPAVLHDELVSMFGESYLPFDVLDQFDAGTSRGPSWYRDATARLVQTIGRRIELSMHLSERVDDGPPDLLAVHFPEADTAGHHFWHLHDLNSPRRPGWIETFIDQRTGRVADPLAQIYEALDSAVGEIVERYCPDVVVIVSDHGMGGSGMRLASINRLLLMEGFLHTTHGIGEAAGDMIETVKRIGLSVIPPDLREEIVGGKGSRVAGTLASRIRLGGIDWSRTAAFSEDLNYAPSVYLNILGREPDGLIHKSERTWFLQMAVDALGAWEADSVPGEMPPGARRVVRSVHLREELFHGPYIDRLPDLVLELDTDAGYSFHLSPGRFRSMDSAVEPMPADLMQGSKGLSMPGSHRPDGIFVAAAVSEKASASCRLGAGIDLQQTSVAPLVLELMGLRAPGHFDTDPERVTDGKLEWVDEHFLADAYQAARSPMSEASTDTEDDRAVKQRLEDLGYI